MNPVLEFILWFGIGMVLGYVLVKVRERWPSLFRKDGWNFWDSVVLGFLLYGCTWILPHAGDHITRIVICVVFNTWYVLVRVHEVRRVRAEQEVASE